MTPPRQLRGVWLGRRPYVPVLQLQETLHTARRQQRGEDVVLLLEHEAVITAGRGSKEGHVLASNDRLARLGVDVVSIGRGGDVTLHAPGQLVAYPLLDLAPERRDVRRYVGDLTATMNAVLATHGLAGGTKDGMIGLWVDPTCPERWPGHEQVPDPVKIGAVGVRISRWVTMHGFALNLTTNMELFGLIVPCGITSHGVTSVQRLLGADHAPSPEAAAPVALEALRRRLEATGGALEDHASASLDAVAASLLP